MVTDFYNRASAPAVQQYIAQIADYVEAHSIQPVELRQKFSRDLKEATADAQSFKETYPAIRQALAGLKDGHSFLCPQEFVTQNDEADTRLPTGKVENGIACISVPGCVGDEERLTAYATHCQNLIKTLDRQKPKAWVIDLRDNDGGNCFPMLAGLGPLFEHGTGEGGGLLGHFVMRQGRESFGYANGATWTEDGDGRGACASVSPNQLPYHLRAPDSPVAVLMGAGTSSAAETVAVAALGLKPRIKVFGGPSAGQATANGPIKGLIDDGAFIALANATYTDRTGKAYGHILQPDVHVAGSGPNDPIPPAALTWIKSSSRVSLRPENRYESPAFPHLNPS